MGLRYIKMLYPFSWKIFNMPLPGQAVRHDLCSFHHSADHVVSQPAQLVLARRRSGPVFYAFYALKVWRANRILWLSDTKLASMIRYIYLVLEKTAGSAKFFNLVSFCNQNQCACILSYSKSFTVIYTLWLLFNTKKWIFLHLFHKLIFFLLQNSATIKDLVDN